MSLIKIDADALMSRSREIEQQISQLESISSRLAALLARIASSWEGEACDRYVSLLQRYLKQIDGMSKVLEEFKKYASGAAKEFSELDSASAGLLRR